jgi:hypothetical protein
MTTQIAEPADADTAHIALERLRQEARIVLPDA